MMALRKTTLDEAAIERIVDARVGQAIVEALAGIDERVEARVAERMAAVLPAAVKRAVPSWIYRDELRALDRLACAYIDQCGDDLRVEVDEDGAVVRWLNGRGETVAWRADQARLLGVHVERRLLADPFALTHRAAQSGLKSIGTGGQAEFHREVARELVKRGRGEVVCNDQ